VPPLSHLLPNINSLTAAQVLSCITSIELPFFARELSMAASNMRSAPAKLPKRKPIVTHSGPMPQQGSMGGHGHEMHPQKFVQLVGCHVSTAKRKTSRQMH
jgi:hypothetical protein